ncbi:NTP transferase domain-containing protein [Guyparkeria halophila]|uniref:NTP transferase domain-containing protein n=2 Tax=Guyparkeria halophila TaxID=47960 RepID=A0A6I6D2M2_9GAMM|nr:NTP transferase domain-containing protein [Guyparkeria halophila]
MPCSMPVDAAAVPPDLVGVVLAAGRAERFGSDKRWAELRGEPLLAHALAAARAVCERVLVVVEMPDPRLDRLLARLPAEAVICPRAGEGLAASRRCAIDRLADERPDGVLFFLGDMPMVPIDQVRHLVEHMRSAGRPVRPVHDSQPGHPVACPGGWLDHLAERGFPAREGRLIDCAHPGVVRDVDCPADLAALR